jgi:hypothetical protein
MQLRANPLGADLTLMRRLCVLTPAKTSKFWVFSVSLVSMIVKGFHRRSHILLSICLLFSETSSRLTYPSHPQPTNDARREISRSQARSRIIRAQLICQNFETCHKLDFACLSRRDASEMFSSHTGSDEPSREAVINGLRW